MYLFFKFLHLRFRPFYKLFLLGSTRSREKNFEFFRAYYTFKMSFSKFILAQNFF